MKRMIASLVVAVTALVATPNLSHAQWMGADPDYEPTWDKVMRTGKLMVGCVPNPPFASVDPSSSEWKGLHVKMASDLAEQMGVEWE